MAEQLYSEIPLRTWNWLGVNEATVAEEVLEQTKTRELTIAAGTKEKLVWVNREQANLVDCIKVQPQAVLELTYLQRLPQNQSGARNLEIHLAEGAKLELIDIEAGGAKSVSKVHINLQGEGAQAQVSVAYFGSQEQELDMNYLLTLAGARTEASLQVEGALSDQCTKNFRGTLDFIKGAKGAKGEEKENVIVLSPKVRNRSVPLMLAGEADVDGHHGVSIGKLEEEKLFYLMSRGLDLVTAKKLVVEAAFAPIISRLDNEDLQQELAEYIKEQLTHEC